MQEKVRDRSQKYWKKNGKREEYKENKEKPKMEK